MDSSVATIHHKAVLTPVKQPFSLRVTLGKQPVMGQNIAVMEATVYEEAGSFVPQHSYLFEAVDAHNQPLTYVDAEAFKQAVDDYCTQVLATEYYVKSIPRASSLCPAAMQAFNF